MSEVTAELASRICAAHGNEPAALIEIFHDIQTSRGAIAEADLRIVADRLNLSRAEVHGAMSFYPDFRRQPAGPIVIRVCRAESCQAMGAAALIESICARHGIELGQTSPQGVTIEPVYCFGNCALSPAVSVNGALMGRADDEAVGRAVDRLAEGTRR